MNIYYFVIRKSLSRFYKKLTVVKIIIIIITTLVQKKRKKEKRVKLSKIHNPHTSQPSDLPQIPPLLRESFPTFLFPSWFQESGESNNCLQVSVSSEWKSSTEAAPIIPRPRGKQTKSSSVHLWHLPCHNHLINQEENAGRERKSLRLVGHLSTRTASFTWRSGKGGWRNELPCPGKLFGNLIFYRCPINTSPFSSDIFLHLLVAPDQVHDPSPHPSSHLASHWLSADQLKVGRRQPRVNTQGV